jgi:hypothetical protein
MKLSAFLVLGNEGEVCMSDFFELLRLAKETVGDLVGRKRVVAEKSWDDIVMALDKLSEISNHHVKAIAEVAGPLVTERNLLETSRRYMQLVNNPDFPQGYDEIRGILLATRTLSTFQAAAIQAHIQNVLDQLTKFQYGVFTISWDSYRVADAVADATRVATSDADVSPEIIEQASQPFVTTFTGLFQETMLLLEGTPKTKEALLDLLQRWFQSWQRHVQRTLYGGKGLNSVIAQLKMMRHA